MTPESAAYHRLMLMVGLRDRFDAEVDHALETDDPITSPLLDLACCLSDTEKVISVLYEYTLAHQIDERKVCDLILNDLRSRYLGHQMTRAEITNTMYSILYYSGKRYLDPWEELAFASNVLELLEDHLISEEVFNECFDAFLLRGERLNAWTLQSKLESRIEKPKLSRRYWQNLAIVIVLMVLSIVSILVAVVVTGNRDMPDFTEHDWLIWLIFLIVEITIIALEFFFAVRCGKLWRQRDANELSIIAKYKDTGLGMYASYEKVYYEHKGPRRAVVFRVDDTYSLSIEHFDFDNLCWQPIEHEDAFSTLGDIVVYLENEQDFFIDSKTVPSSETD